MPCRQSSSIPCSENKLLFQPGVLVETRSRGEVSSQLDVPRTWGVSARLAPARRPPRRSRPPTAHLPAAGLRCIMENVVRAEPVMGKAASGKEATGPLQPRLLPRALAGAPSLFHPRRVNECRCQL